MKMAKFRRHVKLMKRSSSFSWECWLLLTEILVT